MTKILYSFAAMLLACMVGNAQLSEEKIIHSPSPSSVQNAYSVDWDKDGDKDIILVTGGFLVCENLGGGEFAQPVRLWTGNTTFSAYSENSLDFFDIDNDNYIDVLSYADSARIRWIDLSPGIDLPVKTLQLTNDPNGDIYDYIMHGDVDNDGDIDIMVDRKFNPLGTSPLWLKNNSAGFFLNHTYTNLQSFDNPFDVDGDGDKDIIKQTGYSLSWYPNQDGITFGAAVPMGNIPFTNMRILGVADMDGDGDRDIYGTRFNYQVVKTETLWLEQGVNQLFNTAHFSGIYADEDNSEILQFLYIDQDNLMDVAKSVGVSLSSKKFVLNANTQTTWYHNNGDGDFTLAVSALTASGQVPMSGNEDLDNDGFRDPIIQNFINDTNEYLNLFWRSDVTTTNNGTAHDLSYSLNVHNMLVLDRTQDDAVDISVNNRNISNVPTYSILENMSEGRFNAPTVIPQLPLQDAGRFYSEDLWGDDTEEVIFVPVSGTSGIKLYSYNAITDSFTLVNTYSVAYALLQDSYNLDFKDLNNDGLMDLVLFSFNTSAGSAITFLNLNNGNFQLNLIDGLPTGVQIFEDFDGDNYLDLLSSTATIGTYVRYNDGTGNFDSPVTLLPNRSTIHLVLDADGDSDLDFVATPNQASRPFYYIRGADGLFTLGEMFDDYNYTDDSSKSLPPIDIDNDGDMDRVFSVTRQNQADIIETLSYFAVYIKQGNTYISGGIIPGISYSTHNASVEDINHDGYDDFILYRQSDNMLWIQNTYGMGCADSQACNFNPQALRNDGSCCFEACGCDDPAACNYDPAALCNNGTCLHAGCTNPQACNYDPTATCDDGSCSEGINITLSVEYLNFSENSFVTSIQFDNIDDEGNDFTLFSLFNDPTYTTEIHCMPKNCYNVLLSAVGLVADSLEFNLRLIDSSGTQVFNKWMALNSYASNNFGSINLTNSIVRTFCLCDSIDIEGCIDPLATNYRTNATCNDGSCKYLQTGCVFNDINMNGQLDADEMPLANQVLTISPGDIILITDENGNYSIPLTTGSYIITLALSSNFPFNTTPSVQTFAVNSEFPSSIKRRFGVNIIQPITNAGVSIYGSNQRCDTWVTDHITFTNYGNGVLNGVIKVEFDSLLVQIMAGTMPAPDLIVGRTYCYYFQDMAPGTSINLPFNLLTPSAQFIGEYILVSATVTLDSTLNGGPYTQAHTRLITCSYDPNDKQGFPEGYTDAHYVENEDEMEYLIRFQNKGNAEAYNVTIRDTLDANFDFSTFQLVDKSHSVMVSLEPETKELVFFFEDIMLPDSASNEPGSHGFVKYKMKMKNNLPAGTEINNRADIYFDTNPAVLTNTTLHTIFDCAEYDATILTETGGNCEFPELSAQAQALWTENYSWKLDDELVSETDLATITASGEHWLKLEVSNPLCGSRMDSLLVNLQPVTSASITNSDNSLCPNEVSTLTSNYAAGNEWLYNNEVISTDQTLEVSQPGTYSLRVTLDGCLLTETQTEISTTQTEAPVISGDQFGFCSGGEVTLTSNYAEGNEWWLDGEVVGTGQTLVVSQAGTYYLDIVSAECPVAAAEQPIVEFDDAQAIITAASNTFCEGESTLLTSNYSAGNEWMLNGVIIGTDPTLVVTEAGTYVLHIDQDECAPADAQTIITVLENPDAFSFVLSGNSLIVDPVDGATYTWYLNGELIEGANTNVLNFTESGAYTVEVSNSEGCSSSATVNATYIGVDERSGSNLLMYPNPTHDQLTLVLPDGYGNALIRITQADGKLLKEIRSTSISQVIDVSHLSKGIYNVQVSATELVEIHTVLVID
jgi:fimbrial isopeptide formation D2 family protein